MLRHRCLICTLILQHGLGLIHGNSISQAVVRTLLCRAQNRGRTEEAPSREPSDVDLSHWGKRNMDDEDYERQTCWSLWSCQFEWVCWTSAWVLSVLGQGVMISCGPRRSADNPSA